MLTREEVIWAYDGNRVVPERLQKIRDRHYTDLAERMLSIYRNGLGQTRRQLHQQIEGVFEQVDQCPPRRIAAFQKLLDEASVFDEGKRWNTVRQKVFGLAAKQHPLFYDQHEELFGHSATTVKMEIARELKMDWEVIEENLFADIKYFQRLKSFPGYANARALLSRYNVAQAQGVLYDAIRMHLDVGSDLKRVVTQIKLARLMHTIERAPKGHHRITVDGPASVLAETQRYGRAMARFLPTLLACDNWQLSADIKPKRGSGRLQYILDSKCGLSSEATPMNDFDSSVESSFAQKWGSKTHQGWQLYREDIILHQHQKVFIPDFSLRHSDGAEVYLEIAGFWTDDYWQRKRETLSAFANHPILIALPKKHLSQLPECRFPVILYGSSITLKAVLEALQPFTHWQNQRD